MKFFARSRKSRNCAEAYLTYAAQEIAQTDTEIAEKGRFETETVLYYNANSGTPYYPTLPGIVPKRKLTKK